MTICSFLTRSRPNLHFGLAVLGLLLVVDNLKQALYLPLTRHPQFFMSLGT